MREELIDKVKGAARAPVMRLALTPASPPARLPLSHAKKLEMEIVVLGISTGGPQALRQLIPQLPSDFPLPFIVIVHMPVGYTAAFAAKLAEISSVKVREAREGDTLTPGTVLIAPAGRHLTLRKTAAHLVQVRLSNQPLNKPHRPSIDVLFQSAADVYGGRTLAIVMTGMGDDGKAGAAGIKAQGGKVITESEESCIIYGMPRSVVEAGLSDESVTLTNMARTIMKYL
jgi:two-component system chemotaxis response regulator CheB